MRKTVLIAGASFFMATIGSLSAEETQGVIQAVDPLTRQVLLEGGTTVVVSEGIPIESLQPGLEVLVTFEQDTNGNNVATRIELPQ